MAEEVPQRAWLFSFDGRYSDEELARSIDATLVPVAAILIARQDPIRSDIEMTLADAVAGRVDVDIQFRRGSLEWWGYVSVLIPSAYDAIEVFSNIGGAVAFLALVRAAVGKAFRNAGALRIPEPQTRVIVVYSPEAPRGGSTEPAAIEAAYYKDLAPDRAAALVSELSAQVQQVFDKLVETHLRLTQHNFLVNAGGAAAVLAYLGSPSASRFTIWALVCFVVGVVASGIEVRSLVHVYKSLHLDAIRRRSGFVANKLSAGNLGPPPGVGGCAGPIGTWSARVAQAAFVVGAALGVALFVTNV